jgi:hypothetical protein
VPAGAIGRLANYTGISYFPRAPPPAEPCPTEELPAEEAALEPELAAAGALVETDGADDIVPEYPPELVPIVLYVGRLNVPMSGAGLKTGLGA